MHRNSLVSIYSIAERALFVLEAIELNELHQNLLGVKYNHRLDRQSF